MRATRRRKPGEELWAVPELLPVQRSRGQLETLAYVGGSRWRIETEFEMRRVTWGWTNTRPAAGQGGITT